MRQFILNVLLILWAFAAYGPLLAAEPECMRYVPQLGKPVPVPCEEFQAPARPAAPAVVPPSPPAAADQGPAARELEGAGKLKKKLVELTGALTAASADSGFRDTYCTMLATGQIIREARFANDKQEVQRLEREHDALGEKLGERGRSVYTALQHDVMDLALDAPVDTPVDTGRGTRLRQTPEGHAFIKARHDLQLTCNCLREANPPKRMICCDSCDKDTLQKRGAQTYDR